MNNEESAITKQDLQPFTSVLTKNNEIGVIIRFNDTEVVCFRKCIIFLSAYNDDLTLRDRIFVLSTIEDKVIAKYYTELLNIDDYSGYQIIEAYDVEDFTMLHKLINFDVLEKQLLDISIKM